MTNTAMLKDAIKRSGYKTGYIAEQVGISRAALSYKINGRNEFLQNEIVSLCGLLKLSLDEREQIFFAPNVDN